MKIEVPKVEKQVVVEDKVEVVPTEVEAPKEDVAPKKATKSSAGDDLKLIEGIGPKIAEILNTAGVVTFAQLAETTVEKLQAILTEAGSRYASHNPTTWPQQAQLAADGKMDELKELQDKLSGGRPE
ncbi:MAG: helix-hairpin-helix domain-containing protein [Leadbetterella sp.]